MNPLENTEEFSQTDTEETETGSQRPFSEEELIDTGILPTLMTETLEGELNSGSAQSATPTASKVVHVRKTLAQLSNSSPNQFLM